VNEMYRVLLVVDSYALLEDIKKLGIWGRASGFEITDIVHDGISAYDKLRETQYDLVITEIRISGMDGLQLLRNAKREGLCAHIALCSEFTDFNYARQGIILGAYDYFVEPFEATDFISVFQRIKNEATKSEVSKICYADEIVTHFETRNDNIQSYISQAFDEIYSQEPNFIKADKMAKQVCGAVFEEVFSRNQWLSLYVAQRDFYSVDGINESNQASYKERYKKILATLYHEYSKLYPRVRSEKIQEVILYILHHPENNLKQKSIAAELYINSSYLSTVFLSQTGLRFVDYLNDVKLKRAARLLKETDLKIADIAARLDYKDAGYFSRLFKARYCVTPSDYRRPEEYDYQI
jgi:two-component system response regulator YesN